MHDLLLEIDANIFNFVVDQEKEVNSCLFLEMNNGRTIECLEGRVGIDFHYYIRKGESEGIGIDVKHNVLKVRNSYYRLIK